MSNLKNDFDETTRSYLKSLSKYKSLTKKEEHSLFKRYKENNDLDARNKLITSNLKYTCKIANNYRNRGLAFNELISEANQGLIDSIDKFDVNENVKFLSYSRWWIMQRIQTALEKKGKQREQEYIENVSYDSICYDDDMEEESNESEISDENDFFSSNNEAEKERKKRKEIVGKIINCLNKREQDIVKMYYGIDEEKLNLEEIGEKLSITKERVRQIIEGSFKKMRSEALIMIND